MKTKTKTLLISVLTIVLCLSLVVGATFALFTSNSQVDIAVTSGKVEVHASLTNLKIYSAEADEEGTLVDENGSKYKHVELDSFANGGTAVIDGGTLTLDKISAGDKVEFDVEIINASDIAIKYQTSVKLVSGYDLFKGLNVTIDNTPYSGLTEVASWEDLAPTVTDVETKHVVVELPITAGNEYQNLTTSIQFAVEAVQGNAVTVDVDPTAINVFTATDLEVVANMVNSGNNMSGKTIKLVNDIDLSVFANWTPIGNANAPFNGTFDGQNHTISNMTVDCNAEAGLFGNCFSHATIKNVKIDSANITSNHWAGAILGHGYADITYCEVSNSVISVTPEFINGAWDNGDKAGAIVGQERESAAYQVSNNKVTNVTVEGYRDVGGVVGYAYAENVVSNNTVNGLTLLNNRSHNYNNYTTDAAFDVNAIVGEGTPDEGNNAYNVTVVICLAEGIMQYESNVLTIINKTGLINFASLVNAGDTMSGKTIKLNADIDLAGVDWTPIGGDTISNHPSISFAGTFDGQEHIISNLTCFSDVDIYACAGLFGGITGTVKNVKLSNVDVASIHYAGAVVAYASNEGEIKNCHVDGGSVISTPALIGATYDNGDKAGGIAGYGIKVIDSCSVKNLTIKAYRDIGGIAGCIDKGTVSNNTIENVSLSYILATPYAENKSNGNMGDFVGRKSGDTAMSNNTGSCTRIAANNTELNTILSAIKNETVSDHTKYVISLTAPSYDNLKATLSTDPKKEVLLTAPARTTITLSATTAKLDENAIFTVNGHSAYGDKPIIVENIDFVLENDSGKCACAFFVASGNSYRYANNLQIKNCTLTSEGANATKGCFVYSGNGSSLKDFLIEKCTIYSGHSIFSAYCNGLVVKDCIIKAKGGVNNQTAGVSTTIDNCTFECSEYCVRTNGGPLSIKDSTLKTSSVTDSETAIVLRDATEDGHHEDYENYTTLELDNVKLETGSSAQIYSNANLPKANITIKNLPTGVEYTYSGNIYSN